MIFIAHLISFGDTVKILMPTIYHPYMGGITIHVENLIKNLNKIGDYEFHILNYKSEGNTHSEDEFNKYYFDNVYVYEVPYISKIRGPSYFTKGYQLGKKIIKNEGIDLIHSHYAFPQGFLGAFLSKKFDIPHILTLHGSDVLRLSKNPVGKYFFNYAVKNCDNLVCVSNYLKNELIKSKCTCKTKKIDVVYNGVDTDLFYENGNDKNYGLFVGSFVKQKGIEILIESVKDLDFEFILIGDGELFKNFSDKINNEGIENIKLLGKKNQNETAEYIRNCSFLVLPSISEGLGMVLLEAMACGKPVIGTKVGGIPELIKDEYNGFLVPPNNPDELRKKIEILINNNELRKKIGKNGKEFSKNFSWENTAEKIDRIYNSMLKTMH